jgi:hypothetical protein
MKTSIFISSIAALCLLLTFAEAPNRRSGYKMDLSSAKNVSIPSTSRVTMLPGVVITSERKRESAATLPVIPAGNLSYLKFNVTGYQEADAFNPDEAVVLPEASGIDYSYLKFKISDYISEFSGEVINELPAVESNTILAAPAINQFEYLKFDVTDYINSISIETQGFGELPVNETPTGAIEQLAAPVETTNELGYLNFDVTKFYTSANLSSSWQFELPEE